MPKTKKGKGKKGESNTHTHTSHGGRNVFYLLPPQVWYKIWRGVGWCNEFGFPKLGRVVASRLSVVVVMVMEDCIGSTWQRVQMCQFAGQSWSHWPIRRTRIRPPKPSPRWRCSPRTWLPSWARNEEASLLHSAIESKNKAIWWVFVTQPRNTYAWVSLLVLALANFSILGLDYHTYSP